MGSRRGLCSSIAIAALSAACGGEADGTQGGGTGATSNGGAPSSGGSTTASGGSTTGGRSSSGGADAAGGAASAGGADTGGAASAGGSAATGGAAATGGGSSGGSAASGGASSGGAIGTGGGGQCRPTLPSQPTYSCEPRVTHDGDCYQHGGSVAPKLLPPLTYEPGCVVTLPQVIPAYPCSVMTCTCTTQPGATRGDWVCPM